MKHSARTFAFVIVCLSGALNLSFASHAIAKESETEAKTNAQKPTLTRRSVASVTTFVPGLLVGGSGHYLIGETEIAEKLFWTKLSGTLGIIAGGTALATSGASNIVTPWATPILITSGAAFALPTVLDLVGVWSEPREIDLSPLSSASPLLLGKGRFSIAASSSSRETSLSERHFLNALSVTHDLGGTAYRLSGSWTDRQARYELHAEKNLAQGHGWSTWTRLGLTSHLMLDEEISLTQAELSFVSPLRLGSLLGSTLSALSAQLSVGWSGGALRYGKEASDAFTGIIGGFRLIHHSDSDRFRVFVDYEHRHDDWVGGAMLRGLGSGILGYISAGVTHKLSKNFWVGGEASFGSGHLYTLTLEYVLDGARQ